MSSSFIKYFLMFCKDFKTKLLTVPKILNNNSINNICRLLLSVLTAGQQNKVIMLSPEKFTNEIMLNKE